MLTGVLSAHAVVFGADLLHKAGLPIRTDQAPDHRHGAGGVEDVDHRLRIAGRNLHRRVGLAGGRATDQQRQFEAFPFHLFGDVRHFVEGRRDEAAQADDVHLLLARSLENFLTRDHHAEIDDLVIVTAQHHADDVFANVVHVAFDGRHQHFAGVLVLAAGGFLLCFQEGQQISDGFLHHAGGFDDLRQKHLARPEQIADDVHAGHERTFDDGERPAIFLARFLDVLVDVIDDTLDQRVAQTLFDRALAPFIFDHFGLVLFLHRLGELDQTLGGVGPAIEQNVLDESEQVLGNLLIHFQQTGIDDAHVEAGLDGVVEESAVHRFAHNVVAAEAETDVADAAADLGAREVFLDPFRRADEIDGVIGVLLHAGADREDVRIENDVLRREPDFLGEQIVSALGDGDAALEGVGLAALIEGHHDDRRAVTADELRVAKKFFLAFLKTDRVDDAFALKAFQARFDDFPFRGIHHHGHPGDVRFGGDEVGKTRHRSDAIDHAFVHADVDDLRAVLDLLPGDGQGGFEVARLDELGEFG